MNDLLLTSDRVSLFRKLTVHGRWRVAVLLISMVGFAASPGIAEEAKPKAGADGPGSAAEVGRKLADPLSDVWALFTEFNHTCSDGDISDKTRTATHVIFLPIKLGKLPIKFQFSVEKSVVRQDIYGKEWNFRLNVIPVIQSLIKDPLF